MATAICGRAKPKAPIQSLAGHASCRIGTVAATEDGEFASFDGRGVWQPRSPVGTKTDSATTRIHEPPNATCLGNSFPIFHVNKMPPSKKTESTTARLDAFFGDYNDGT
jgi:hypothetical protein